MGNKIWDESIHRTENNGCTVQRVHTMSVKIVNKKLIAFINVLLQGEIKVSVQQAVLVDT